MGQVASLIRGNVGSSVAIDISRKGQVRTRCPPLPLKFIPSVFQPNILTFVIPRPPCSEPQGLLPAHAAAHPVTSARGRKAFTAAKQSRRLQQRGSTGIKWLLVAAIKTRRPQRQRPPRPSSLLWLRRLRLVISPDHEPAPHILKLSKKGYIKSGFIFRGPDLSVVCQ
jgi:hypothetical protein